MRRTGHLSAVEIAERLITLELRHEHHRSDTTEHGEKLAAIEKQLSRLSHYSKIGMTLGASVVLQLSGVPFGTALLGALRILKELYV